jgi:type I restriction enzyme, S subunit
VTGRDGWRNITLRDAARWLSGGTPRTSNPEYWGGEIPWISASSLREFLISDSERRVTALGASSGTRVVPGDTVIMVVRGMSLKTEFRVGITTREVAFGQDCKALLAKDGVHPGFLAYTLEARSPEILHMVDEAGHGTGRLATDRLERLTIPFPPLRTQRRIAALLRAYDDKLVANAQLIVKLEATAASLFELYFQPALNYARTESSLPAEWKGCLLGDVLTTLETGSRPPGGVAAFTEGVPSVGAESIKRLGVFDYTKLKYVPRSFFDSMRRGHVEDRDVLLYKDGGRPGQFEPHATIVGGGFPFTEFAINEHVFRLQAHPPISQEYLYFWLTSPPLFEAMRRRGTGVAIPGLNSQAVRSLPFVEPPAEQLAAFDAKAKNLVTSALSAATERTRVRAMRGALLRPLVDGDVVPQDLASDTELVR